MTEGIILYLFVICHSHQFIVVAPEPCKPSAAPEGCRDSLQDTHQPCRHWRTKIPRRHKIRRGREQRDESEECREQTQVFVSWCYVKSNGSAAEGSCVDKSAAAAGVCIACSPTGSSLWVALFLMRATGRREGMKGVRGASVSLLMEWSLFQLSQASEPQLRPGQDDVYNVSNCCSWFSNSPS